MALAAVPDGLPVSAVLDKLSTPRCTGEGLWEGTSQRTGKGHRGFVGVRGGSSMPC